MHCVTDQWKIKIIGLSCDGANASLRVERTPKNCNGWLVSQHLQLYFKDILNCKVDVYKYEEGIAFV